VLLHFITAPRGVKPVRVEQRHKPQLQTQTYPAKTTANMVAYEEDWFTEPRRPELVTATGEWLEHEVY